MSPIEPRNLKVTLMDAQGAPVIMWAVYNAFLLNWQIEAFDSAEGDIPIDRIELAYASPRRTKLPRMD